MADARRRGVTLPGGFVDLHARIWSVLRDEVLKGYRQQVGVAAAVMPEGAA